MKVLISFFMLTMNTMCTPSLAQKSDLLDWLNDDLEFHILLESAQLDFEKMEMTPHKFSYVLELTPSQLDEVKQITYAEWEYLLNDINRGYLVNVLLNSIFDKGLSHYDIEKRKEWFYDNREDEIKLWKSFLKKNLPIDSTSKEE